MAALHTIQLCEATALFIDQGRLIIAPAAAGRTGMLGEHLQNVAFAQRLFPSVIFKRLALVPFTHIKIGQCSPRTPGIHKVQATSSHEQGCEGLNHHATVDSQIIERNKRSY